MENHLLSRILTGEATSEEKEAFYRQLAESKDEEKLFYEVKSLWLKASMHKTKVDIDSEFNLLWTKIKQPEKKITYSIGRKLLQYAAILVAMFSIGGLSGYFISQTNIDLSESSIQKYTAMKGSVSTIEFADGTKVWLNSGSELTYREDHKNKQRLAELKGEAYFEVTHRENFPLFVKTGQIVVRDLGTTFNIKAYPDDTTIETSLIEGKADILNASGLSLAALNPGESALYFPEEKRIEFKSITQDVVSSWRNGKFVIRNQRLEDIFKELGRWYDVDFRFENQALRDYRYTGSIKKSTTAQHVLKMLKLTTNFNYRIIEKPTKSDVIIIY